ncbi:hypothetical protein [Stackebrandtia nassauensis]|uniref:D-alanyl-D-alanine carboxypeptidase n=1 Tax=Stackebrandtia nassauensis (strain DSM 44728 / CIP 108903 / NRRL B-16338 / NBRC 102104 / LLR-40K-21) TaxID=446470 RepID=D3Q2S6_STANL|nr:hypothetical protein [Stackebrandtia nassauensis]ADD45827.1 hypothetical protein Snas_6204 [Stackebrandtia nassauensis DSM 44728]
MSINFTDQDKTTLRTAAYGAIELLAAASAAGGSPHKVATDGSIALGSATGAIGHVLAEKQHGAKLKAKSVADIADQVLPALTEAAKLLKSQDAAEADNFRSTLMVAIEAATQRVKPSPTLADMTRKIIAALDAA